MPPFGPIRCVTIATADVAASVALYDRFLGYQLVAQGPVGAALSAVWNLPQLARRQCALLRPGSGANTFIRFVESQAPPDYAAFCHFGWNAAEIMVQDTDAVAAQLAGSAFKLIGPPANLSFTDKIRAMQVLGPSGESLYLTSFKAKMAEFDVPEARSFIDEVFIVILGGASTASINDFYHAHLRTDKAASMNAVISVLSRAQGLPADTKHELAAIQLAGKSYIEADAMPAGTKPRHTLPGELPPAISLVSFAVDSLANTQLQWLAAPQILPQAPYFNHPVAVAIGPAGELIELIET